MIDESYQKGFDDEKLNKGFLDNPYKQDSREARRWVDGYVDSMIERRKLDEN